MNRYAVFLRGVNVGGNTIVKMNELKDALVVKEFENVKTYINSGNIVFHYNGEKGKAKEIIKEVIKSQFNLVVEMIIKAEEELAKIIKNEPFNPEKENDNSKRMVVMLSDKIVKDDVLNFKNDKNVDENFYYIDDVIYIYYHNEAGRSKFTNNYIEKKLDVISTTRNWNTILKMDTLLKE